MSTPPMSLETKRAALDLVAQHGSMAAAARAVGLPEKTFAHRYRMGLAAAERGEFGTSPVIPGFRINQTTAVTGKDGETVREFIQQRPERGGEYVPLPGLNLKGKTTFVDVVGDERKVTREVYMERKGQFDPTLLVEALNTAFADIPARKPVSYDHNRDSGNSALLAVYPLIDFHVGLMSWAQETGENYDLKIGRETIMPAMRRLIAATPAADEAVILGIGDLLHFDGFVHETPASGHPLDADGRYPKVLETAADMVEEIVELALARHRRVTLRILRGNHDPVSAVAVAMALKRVFRANKRVTVDVDQSYNWWFRRGKVFLGGSHGDKAKMRDLPMVMAHDRPEDWAASTYRRIYTGHVHHESMIEEGGVIVTSMRSPVAKDAYHSFNKWRSGRSVYSETFNIDGSEAATLTFNL
jgi:hypothetical protein